MSANIIFGHTGTRATNDFLPAENLAMRRSDILGRIDLSSGQIRDGDFPLNDANSADRALENIYALFGRDTTLIPLPLGKVVADGLRRTTTLAESIKSSHQTELRKSNVAVQCGKESRNLYAIHFDRRTDYEAFLLSNPKLHKTLATESEGLVIVFIRIPDPMPPSFRFESGTWLSEGAVILVFNRENPGAIKVLSPHPPVELGFSEIRWHKDMEMGFRRFVMSVSYGEAFVRDKKGNWNINAMYWANLYCAATAISFRPDAQTFLLWEKDGTFRPASEMAVGKALLDFIVKWREDAMASSVTEEGIRKCLQALKMIAVDPTEQATGADHLERFLRDSIEPCAGTDITSEEFHEHYRAWSNESNVVPLAEGQFVRKLPLSVAKVFGVGKNHCIQRNGTERRGYSGLRIKESAVLQDG